MTNRLGKSQSGINFWLVTGEIGVVEHLEAALWAADHEARSLPACAYGFWQLHPLNDNPPALLVRQVLIHREKVQCSRTELFRPFRLPDLCSSSVAPACPAPFTQSVSALIQASPSNLKSNFVCFRLRCDQPKES